MATDATGTPTSLGIPKYNTSADAPSGLGFNAAMDSINTLLVARVSTNSVQTAGATVLANKLLIGDANAAFSIVGNGQVQWGAGAAGPLDTNLYRGVSAGFLRTDNQFIVGSGVSNIAAAAGSVALSNVTPAAGNPSGGGLLYVEGGALKFRGSSGTVTTIAAA
jgi:hypothetical protein